MNHVLTIWDGRSLYTVVGFEVNADKTVSIFDSFGKNHYLKDSWRTRQDEWIKAVTEAFASGQSYLDLTKPNPEIASRDDRPGGTPKEASSAF